MAAAAAADGAAAAASAAAEAPAERGCDTIAAAAAAAPDELVVTMVHASLVVRARAAGAAACAPNEALRLRAARRPGRPGRPGRAVRALRGGAARGRGARAVRRAVRAVRMRSARPGPGPPSAAAVCARRRVHASCASAESRSAAGTRALSTRRLSPCVHWACACGRRGGGGGVAVRRLRGAFGAREGAARRWARLARTVAQHACFICGQRGADGEFRGACLLDPGHVAKRVQPVTPAHHCTRLHAQCTCTRF